MEGIGPPPQTRRQSRREEGVGSQGGRGRLEVGRTGILDLLCRAPVVPWDWEPVTGMGSALATGLGAVGVGETTELAVAGGAKPCARDQCPAST